MRELLARGIRSGAGRGVGMEGQLDISNRLGVSIEVVLGA